MASVPHAAFAARPGLDVLALGKRKPKHDTGEHRAKSLLYNNMPCWVC